MATTARNLAAPGILTELQVASPGACPVAEASRRARASAGSVDRSVPVGSTVTEDFTVDADLDLDGAQEVTRPDGGRTYRFVRDATDPCVCDTVESFGLPVSKIRARNGSLILTFLAPDVETVRAIVSGVRDRFDDVSIRHLSRFDGEDTREPVLVDRSRLTDRQQEVLETALEMGYFGHPKGANAQDVAAALDVCPSTFSEHLAAAQSKIMDAVVHG